MILKRGVTGFTGADLSLERDWIALQAEFKKNCALYVQQLNGKFLTWYEPDFDSRYAHAHVEIEGIEFYIFYNKMYDYIAFSTNRSIGDLKYIDHPLMKAQFENRYHVLAASDLDEPLVRQAKDSGQIVLPEEAFQNNELSLGDYILLNENELNENEIGFMNYFWSCTVGDLVFNYWD